jgi:hypothetical protein
MNKASFPQIDQPDKNYAPLEPHTAESRWQFCNCRSCQDRRRLIDSAPGTKIDFATYRKKDERY